MKRILLSFLTVILFLLISSIVTAQKIDPELIGMLTSKSPTEIINVILIANQPLSSSNIKKLSELNAMIVRNFTLAPWYEIEIPAENIYKLQDLAFVQEIKPVKKYKPLVNEAIIGTLRNNLNFVFILVLIIIAVFIFLFFRKKITFFTLFFLVTFVFISLVFVQSKEVNINDKILIPGEVSWDLKIPIEINGKDTLIKNFRSETKIDPQILSYPDENIRVIVELNKEDNYINTLSITSPRKLQKGNILALTIPKSKISELNNSPLIKKVWLDKRYEPLLDVSVPLIKANEVWNIGYNGSGIKVCVLDTGINKTHPALSSRVIDEKDFSLNDWDGNDTRDYAGHGTHIAGILASTDPTYKGVAPGAFLLNAKVFHYDTRQKKWYAYVSDIMEGIDWCISRGANILTLSLGSTTTPNDGSDILSIYADLAVDQGKVVTIAGGNEGPGNGTLLCPGCAHKVITVGATYKQSYPVRNWGSCIDLSPSQDQLACFSSRGPTNDSRIKPDVVAPGVNIMSVNAGWENDDDWINASGTSMATPIVAGLSALLLQAKPTLTPEEVKALLMNSAEDLGTSGKDNDYGAGRVDALRAFNEINNTYRGVISNFTKVHNIYVPLGSSEIRATLYWPENHSLHNDVDLYLLDPAGNVKANSTSVWNTDEMVKLTSPSPSGNWKLLIYPHNVTGTQVYALASNFKPSDERYILVHKISQITYHQLNVTDSSKPLVVNLDWNSSNVDLNIYLYNISGHLVNSSAASNTNYEEVSVNNPIKGIWFARLVPFDLAGYPSVQYSLTSTFPVSDQIIDTASPIILDTIIIPSKARPSSNATLISTITDLSGVDYAYVTGYDSSWNTIFQLQNLTYLDDSWILIFNTSNISDGIYYFNITAIDKLGNNGTVWVKNLTINQTSGAINVLTRTSVSTTNNQVIINATNETNTTLEITTTRDVSNAVISIAAYSENPSNVGIDVPALNKYLEITTSSGISNSLLWTVIKIYYNDSDVPHGYSEKNLRIYRQNPYETWSVYDGILVGGVNTIANYVWANTTNFSIYGVFIKPTCDDGIKNQGEEGVDCGGPCSACPASTQRPPPAAQRVVLPVSLGVCEENWSCTDWSECFPNNTQTRTCVDLNRCGTVTKKPNEIISCVYSAPKALVCGNGICETGENQTNCCLDCGCPTEYECRDNICVKMAVAPVLPPKATTPLEDFVLFITSPVGLVGILSTVTILVIVLITYWKKLFIFKKKRRLLKKRRIYSNLF